MRNPLCTNASLSAGGSGDESPVNHLKPMKVPGLIACCSDSASFHVHPYHSLNTSMSSLYTRYMTPLCCVINHCRCGSATLKPAVINNATQGGYVTSVHRRKRSKKGCTHHFLSSRLESQIAFLLFGFAALGYAEEGFESHR